MNLRKDIVKHANYPPNPSEQGVYTRLKPSETHKGGVGVFAITNIFEGTEIFSGNESEVYLKESSELDKLPSEMRSLHDDFCVIRNKSKSYGCPKNFNNMMTVGGYLNHSNNPNVKPDAECRFLQ